MAIFFFFDCTLDTLEFQRYGVRADHLIAYALNRSPLFFSDPEGSCYRTSLVLR
jgi:hypothetical protein